MQASDRTPVIERIRAFPRALRSDVGGLSSTNLTTHFLPREWSVAQHVHHLAARILR